MRLVKLRYSHIMVDRSRLLCFFVVATALVLVQCQEEDPAWFSLLDGVREDIIEEARYTLNEGASQFLLLCTECVFATRREWMAAA